MTEATHRPADQTAKGDADPRPRSGASQRSARLALARLATPARPGQRRAAVLSVVAALLWPVQAALIAHALAALLDGRAVSPGLIAGGFVLLGLIRAALTDAAEAAAQAAAETAIGAARADLVATEAARAADSPWGGAGAIAALAGPKLDLLGPWITRYAPARARVAILPPLLLAVALSHSWAAALILLISGPLIPVFMALIGLAARDASARQMTELGTLTDLLLERLSALPDIRLLGAGNDVTQDLAARSSALRHRAMAVLRIAFLSSTVLELFAALGIAMMAVYVGFSLLGEIGFGTWGPPLSPAAGIFLLLIVPDFYQPLRDLAAAWHDRAAAEAVADEYAALCASPTTARPGTGGPPARPLPPPDPAAPLISVTGCLTPDGRPLPDLHIATGETLALVGASGAGKTTLLRLIAGLIPAAPGQVTIAGHPLDSSTADAWRARLGAMPQSPHFLNASLRSNVAMGRDGDIAAALDATGMTGIVAALPSGTATRLGETGAGLSGGEARRLTLARALHGGPDLILADEPTADLDAETAARVTAALMAAADDGATLVIATHDARLAARMGRRIHLGPATT